MAIINRSVLRRGLVGGVFVAALAAGGPAGLAYAGPDDIDNYGVSDTNTLTIAFGSTEYSWTDTTPFNAILSVDDTTGKSTPVFNFPTVTENTTTLPSGYQSWGYGDQNTETLFQGDNTTTVVSNSEIAYNVTPTGSEFVFDPFSSESATVVGPPDGDTAPF